MNTTTKSRRLQVSSFFKQSFKCLSLLLVISVLHSTTASATNIIHPIFPNGTTNASSATKIIFQSTYPINTEKLYSTSPQYVDNQGNLQNTNAQFYVIPNEYINVSDKQNYAMPCRIFVSDSNLITILPERPFSYSRSYAVIFNDFPLLIPDISKANGYYEQYETSYFPNYFTVISAPFSISNIPFQKNNNMVWCSDDGIEVNFTKQLPTALNNERLQAMFEIADENLDFPSEIQVSNDRKSIKLFPNTTLPSGNYMLKTNFREFLGDDGLNREYNFTVPDEIVVTVGAYSKNSVGKLPGECINSTFGSYKTYKMGDTVNISFPNLSFDEEYYLANWDVTDANGADLSDYSIEKDGKLQMILDCENQNKTNHINVKAVYRKNPIDTLFLQFDASFPSYLLICSVYHVDFRRYYQLSNSMNKLDNNTFTFKRYSNSNDAMTLQNRMNYEYSFPYWCFSNYWYDRYQINAVNLNGLDIPIGAGHINIERDTLPNPVPLPIAPAAPDFYGNLNINGNSMYGRGSFHLGLSESMDYNADICSTYNSNPGRPKFSLYLTIEGEDPSIFSDIYNNPAQLFSKIEFGGKQLAPTVDQSVFNFYAAESHRKPYSKYLHHLPVGPPFANMPIPSYHIEIAPQYRHLYEIYYYYENFNSSGKHYLEFFQNEGRYELKDTMRLAAGICANELHIQIRKKIVELEFSATKKEKNEIGVPTYNQANLKFTNAKPIRFASFLGLGNIMKLLPNGSEKNAIYGNRKGPLKNNITFNNKQYEVTEQETTSYFFYAGTVVDLEIFLEDYAGFKFENWNVLPNSTQSMPTKTSLNIFLSGKEKKDRVEALLGEDFRLNFIGLMEPNTDDASNFIYYAVDKESNSNLPKWRNDMYNFDKGAGMNAEWSYSNLRNYTTAIRFIFNDYYNASTLENNIKISDIIKIPKDTLNEVEGCFRDDGKPIVDNYDYIRYLSSFINMWGEIGHIWEVHLKEPYSICHLQPFRININNLGGCIKASDGTELSNIPKDEINGINFNACTEPPGIMIKSRDFCNYAFVDNWWHGDDIEPIITGFSIVDKGKFTVKDIYNYEISSDKKEIKYISPVDNSLEFRATTHRFPRTGSADDIGKNDCLDDNRMIEFVPTISYKNRFMLNYHWVDDDEGGDCEDVVDFAVTVIAALITGEVIGGSDSTKTPKAATAGSDSTLNKIGEAVSKLLCDADNDLLDYNAFWLDYTGYANPTVDACGEPLSWGLWGVGKYKMYTDCVKHAYGKSFKLAQNAEGKWIPISCPGTTTSIYIGLGDISAK